MTKKPTNAMEFFGGPKQDKPQYEKSDIFTLARRFPKVAKKSTVASWLTRRQGRQIVLAFLENPPSKWLPRTKKDEKFFFEFFLRKPLLAGKKIRRQDNIREVKNIFSSMVDFFPIRERGQKGRITVFDARAFYTLTVDSLFATASNVGNKDKIDALSTRYLVRYDTEKRLPNSQEWVPSYHIPYDFRTFTMNDERAIEAIKMDLERRVAFGVLEGMNGREALFAEQPYWDSEGEAIDPENVGDKSMYVVYRMLRVSIIQMN